MTVPYIFANAIGSLPLLELDVNFASVSNSIASATGNITFNDTTISTAVADSNIVVSTNSGNAVSNWTFNSNGQLRIAGPITSTDSITLFANTTGASNITLIANGALGNSQYIFDSTGNLTAPGNIIADAFIGSGEYISDLLLNSTVGNIVTNIANTNSNLSNTNSNVANNSANIVTLTTGLASTNSNVANTNSNVANLTITVANITANIGNLQANSYSNVNTASYLQVYGGNIFANNINSTGNVGAQFIYAARDIYATGNLYVNGTDTVFDTTQITSNVLTLTLNHDVTSANIADLNGSGLLLGQNGLVSWLYDFSTNSWQTNVDIQPKVSTASLGNTNNPWQNIYANTVNSANIITTSIAANVVAAENLSVSNLANVVSLAVTTDAIVAGDLYVNGNSTLISSTAISSNVSTLILDKDNSSGILADGSGIQIGLPGIATFLYNYPTTSWQSSIDLTPASNTTANLGNINNQWENVYAIAVTTANVITGNVFTANVFSGEVYGNTLYAYGNVYSDILFGNSANINGPLVANTITAVSLIGTITTPLQTNITEVGNLVNLNVVGNIFSGNISVTGEANLPTINSNVVNANILNANTFISTDISVTGNVTANFFIGNGSQLSNLTATTAATVTSNAQPNITSVGTLTSLSVTGNIDSSNVTVESIIANIVSATTTTTESIIGNVGVITSITGNVINANTVSVVGNITTDNFFLGNGRFLTGMPELYGNSNVANYLPMYTGNLDSVNNITANTINTLGNVSAVGTVYANAVVGNTINVGQVSATGNITTDNFFLGNGRFLTGMPELYGNSNVANYLPIYTGNFTAANISITGDITANGNLLINTDTVIQGNLQVNGTTTTINSNIIVVNDLYIQLANNQNTYSLINNAGLQLGDFGNGDPLVNLTYSNASNSWITNVGLSTAQNISAAGNITANFFIGDGSAVANVVALTVSENAQPNITSVGSLTSLTVTGNTRSDNVFTSGRISSTGNITSAGNIDADYFIGNGSLLSNVVANVTQLINGSYTVVLNSSGTLQYANVNDQQQALTGTTTTVYGDPYTIDVNPGLTEIIWTSTSNTTVGFKMAVRTQTGNSGAITNIELAEISCASDGTLANTSYTVYNRVKSNISAPNTEFTVLTNINGNLIVRATNTNSTVEYFTHSVTEFTKT